ncbi:FAD-binding oxidoreductase [uncultured Mucilaginibacter sp.]|uniref:FAD-binding oxidoreductase n=1 Tax=uncultured Mucilaginibacter sp. TaxID=797541 RepID=UPI0025D21CCC|nr:FAD-binding oxidoreductase [uncultured Mucilaginibacter sp.]
MRTYTLKVIGLKQETVDTLTVVFKQPGLKKIKYKAGQYLTLIIKVNNRRYIRPYSFSSAPGVEKDLEITVKRVQGGVVSNHILDKVQIGDIIEVIEPMGKFVLPEEFSILRPHIVLWGAGSGITPLISIAKYALHAFGTYKVTLVYGNRNSESVIFADKLAELSRLFPDRLKIWNFHTQLIVEDSNPYVVQGRINPQIVLDMMNNHEVLTDAFHYICGPIGLKQSVKTELSKFNIDERLIHSEDFELQIDPEQLSEVRTQKVIIEKDGIQNLIEVVKGKSLLEAGLDSSLDLPYSCQTGSCFICKGRLKGGKVKTISSDEGIADLNEDELLLCCSFPVSDDVYIISQ